MKIYKVTWYLYLEEQMKQVLVTRREDAEEIYTTLKFSLSKGCWASMRELEENEDHVLIEGEVLHYNDF